MKGLVFGEALSFSAVLDIDDKDRTNDPALVIFRGPPMCITSLCCLT